MRLINRLAVAIGHAVARVGFRASHRRRAAVVLIESDADVGFILGTTLRDSGFAVLWRDRVDPRDWRWRGVVLASIGLGPEATGETAWLSSLRTRCPRLPVLVVASFLGRPLEAALRNDRHARVVYHPVTAEQYLAAVNDLLGATPRAAA